jgi:hypothetical protein
MPSDSERSFWQTAVKQTDQQYLDSQSEINKKEDLLAERREQAIECIKTHKIHRFRVLLILYFIVNALMIATWLLSVWMGWSQYFNGSILIVTIGIWGCLVGIVGYRAYQGADYNEEQIQHEMQNCPE